MINSRLTALQRQKAPAHGSYEFRMPGHPVSRYSGAISCQCFFWHRKRVTDMLLPPIIVKKLQKATCDRRDLDRRFLHLHHCFKEVEKALGTRKKKWPVCLSRAVSKHKKSPTPQLPISAKSDLSVRLQGLEPWTNRLRVYCSTSWARGAFSWTQRIL